MKGSNSILPLRVPLPLLFHINQLIECNKKPLKKSKVELLITVRGEDSFKGFRFVCEPSVAEELHTKCRYLIRMNSSKLRTNQSKPSFRRHNSLSLRRKTMGGASSFEIWRKVIQFSSSFSYLFFLSKCLGLPKCFTQTGFNWLFPGLTPVAAAAPYSHRHSHLHQHW